MVTLKSPQVDRSRDRLDDHRNDRNPGNSTTTSPIVSSLKWSDSVQSLLDQPASILPLKFTFAGFLFLSAFLTWAWVGQVDEVAKAPGKLGPQDESVKVQPVELGKVTKVSVQEGDMVQQGQVLMALESELDTRGIEQLQTVLMAQQSELNQTEVMVEKIRSQLDTRSMIARSDLQSQRASISQNESIAQTQTVLNRQLEDDISAQQQRIEKFRTLANEGAYPRDQLLQMEQTVRERERSITEGSGKLKQAVGDRDRLNADLLRKQSEAMQVQLSTQQEMEELRLRQTEIRSKMQETRSQIAAANAKKDQRFVYAPASGKITTLNLKHSGQVVQPGDAIAEISPQGKPLILSTLLPSQEAGFVKPDMVTQIKLDAFPYQDFGVLSGTVLSVSPDSKTLKDGAQVYRVDIALDHPNIRVRGQTIELATGQTATAEIITRRRRIMDLLLDPIKQLQGNISL
jgi:hemolysin D